MGSEDEMARPKNEGFRYIGGLTTYELRYHVQDKPYASKRFRKLPFSGQFGTALDPWSFGSQDVDTCAQVCGGA